MSGSVLASAEHGAISSPHTGSPGGPRAKNSQAKNATQAPRAPNGGQRRPRGSRANNDRRTTHQSPSQGAVNTQDPAFSDSGISTTSGVPIPSARNVKKHVRSQPSSDRNQPDLSTSSLTDSELVPNAPSATPAKAQTAYAGPTFHASPAPSALPIPKFLSRSVPAKPASAPLLAREDRSDSTSPPSPSPPSPSRAPGSTPRGFGDSPLDLLFKADRAERARNRNGSPGLVGFPNSPGNIRNQHSAQDTQGSLSVMFPIELDADSKQQQASLPPPFPGASRSVTAPSRIPQAEVIAPPTHDADVIQDLLGRLSHSQQKKYLESTPPRNEQRIPSEPSSRHQTPSPFNDNVIRSASGPSAPAPSNQESSDFFYGNRNLSPLFKAAKNDASGKRNSGLRTEITADSPTIVSRGDFSSLGGMPNLQTDTASYPPLDPSSHRRGSAPQVQPIRESPNNRRGRPFRRAGIRSYNQRPDSYPHAHKVPVSDGEAPAKPKSTIINPFIPSSVMAKQYNTSAKPPDPLALEQDLKRLLNLKVGDTPGVR